MYWARLNGLFVFTALLSAQPVLHLKTRSLSLSSRASSQEKPVKTRDPGRRHWIVQFPAWPQTAQLAALRSGGMRLLGYVPDFGFSISAADTSTLRGLGLLWIGNLNSAEKLSPKLEIQPAATDVRFVIVEFFADVDMNGARSIANDLGLQIQESPDLLDHHLLLSGTWDQITSLAEWDEVSYIFPASDDLVQGVPVHGCAGALTDQGNVGQSIQRVGEGWGSPGKNGADLNYVFVNKTPKIPADGVTASVARAFAEWAKYAKLTFTPSADINGSRTITIFFGSRSHGDNYPFDGPGGILAHTFYPFPVNPEPIAGDMHFDADENWQMGADVDLFSVALHETGHALGLGHSDKPGAVMYPYYRQSASLTTEDIAAALAIYEARDVPTTSPLPLALIVDEADFSTTSSTVTLHGAALGGSGDVAVTWTETSGFGGKASGVAKWTAGPIPLNAGVNTITVTARDAQQAQIVRTITAVRQPASAPPSGPPASGPQLEITSPVPVSLFTTASPSLTIAGTAADPSGVARVNWSNSRGGAGQASGTNNWSTGSIALLAGTSTITVTVVAHNGVMLAKTLQVSYSPVAAGNGSAPPSLTIVLPALTTISTPASSIAVSGTARDNVAVASVTWVNSTGASGVAAGTGNWSIGAIPLLVGTNTITIRAINSSGGSTWRSLVVTRL